VTTPDAVFALNPFARWRQQRKHCVVVESQYKPSFADKNSMNLNSFFIAEFVMKKMKEKSRRRLQSFFRTD